MADTAFKIATAKANQIAAALTQVENGELPNYKVDLFEHLFKGKDQQTYLNQLFSELGIDVRQYEKAKQQIKSGEKYLVKLPSKHPLISLFVDQSDEYFSIRQPNDQKNQPKGDSTKTSSRLVSVLGLSGLILLAGLGFLGARAYLQVTADEPSGPIKITGRVLTQKNQPVQGFVRLYKKTAGDYKLVTTVSSQRSGNYTLAVSQAGEYRVCVSESSFSFGPIAGLADFAIDSKTSGQNVFLKVEQTASVDQLYCTQ